MNESVELRSWSCWIDVEVEEKRTKSERREEVESELGGGRLLGVLLVRGESIGGRRRGPEIVAGKERSV